jgi:hypothetical protein
MTKIYLDTNLVSALARYDEESPETSAFTRVLQLSIREISAL